MCFEQRAIARAILGWSPSDAAPGVPGDMRQPVPEGDQDHEFAAGKSPDPRHAERMRNPVTPSVECRHH